MKLLLVTKEDWKNANWGIRILNAILELIALLWLIGHLNQLLDWLGIRNYSSSNGTQSSTTWPQGSQRTTGLNPLCSVESSVDSIL